MILRPFQPTKIMQISVIAKFTIFRQWLLWKAWQGVNGSVAGDGDEDGENKGSAAVCAAEPLFYRFDGVGLVACTGPSAHD